MSDLRELHLLGATGTARTEMIGGKEYLVVPVVALMEGVIHAVNAETPEFVPVATLEKAAKSWDGKPVTLGHPKKDGKQCSANSPAVLEAFGIGTLRNTRVEGNKMLTEALIEKVRTKKLHPDMYARLAEGGTEEVSVGALVITDKKPGKWMSKSFIGSWVAADGDHLAFLPGGRGACSVEMGCGTHRAAMRVCGDHLEDVVEDDSKEKMNLRAPSCLTFTTLEGDSLNDRIRSVQDAVQTAWNKPQPSSYAYASQVFDDFAIVCVGEDHFKVPYTINDDGEVELGDPVAVKQEWVAASSEDEIKILAGARHSTRDMKAIQAVHDHSMALGATCDRANYKLMESKPKEEPTKNPTKKPTDATRFYIERIKQQKVK